MVSGNKIPSGFKLLKLLKGHRGKISKIAWSYDGKLLASCSDDKKVIIWDVQSGRIYKEFIGHSDRIYSISWSPDGNYLVSTSKDKTVRFWDVASGEEYNKIKKNIGIVIDVTWSPYGRIVATGSADSLIRIWDVRNNTLKDVLKGHSGTINCLAWIDKGRILASASNDMTIRLWDTKGWVCKKILKGHLDRVYCLSYSEKENILVSGSKDNTIKIWDIANGKIISSLEGHQKEVSSLTFDYSNNFIASKSGDNNIFLWRYKKKKQDLVAILKENRPKKNKLTFSGLSFHPSELSLATLGEEDTAIRIWNLDFNHLESIDPVSPSIHYINAKAVLIGNSGVGKTGLGIRIAEKQYKLTESSHGAHFWHIPIDSKINKLKDASETHVELTLWDLAGQSEYRLVHQLFIDDVDVAILLFDCSNESDPLRGIDFWLKVLKKSTPEHSRRYLVASRCDVSSPTITGKEIDQIMYQHNIQKYIVTSAKTGEGVQELIDDIIINIPWDRLPRTTTPWLFQNIRQFLLRSKEESRVLLTYEEILHEIKKCYAINDIQIDEVKTVVCLLQSRGLVFNLKPTQKTDLVFLKPEMINNYAASIIQAARNHPKGIGAVPERDVLTASIY